MKILEGIDAYKMEIKEQYDKEREEKIQIVLEYLLNLINEYKNKNFESLVTSYPKIERKLNLDNVEDVTDELYQLLKDKGYHSDFENELIYIKWSV